MLNVYVGLPFVLAIAVTSVMVSDVTSTLIDLSFSVPTLPTASVILAMILYVLPSLLAISFINAVTFSLIVTALLAIVPVTSLVTLSPLNVNVTTSPSDALLVLIVIVVPDAFRPLLMP